MYHLLRVDQFVATDALEKTHIDLGEGFTLLEESVSVLQNGEVLSFLGLRAEFSCSIVAEDNFTIFFGNDEHCLLKAVKDLVVADTQNLNLQK